LPADRALPAPQGIFPRYVEAEAASAGGWCHCEREAL